jgi:hypothetical protein
MDALATDINVPLAGKKLGVLITVGPDNAKFPLALALLAVAQRRGLKIYLYCVDDGVLSVSHPQIQEYKAGGVHLFGCAYGAGKRGLALTPQATWSGLTMLSDILGSTDRFISF